MTSATQEATVTSGKTSPNGTRYCRTCGYSDCPSLDLDSNGECPRWPTRQPDPDPAYALLTLDDLYDLHARLGKQSREIHATLMHGQVPLISPLSDEWVLRSARADEINETAESVYAEITRRETRAYGA